MQAGKDSDAGVGGTKEMCTMHAGYVVVFVVGKVWRIVAMVAAYIIKFLFVRLGERTVRRIFEPTEGAASQISGARATEPATPSEPEEAGDVPPPQAIKRSPEQMPERTQELAPMPAFLSL